MKRIRHLMLLLCLAVAMPMLVWAQQAEPAVNILINGGQVRFASRQPELQVHLVVTNQRGETLYDSGFNHVGALPWNLTDNEGKPLAGGLYRYTLTLHDTNGATPHTHKGSFILEQDANHLWIATQDETAIGADIVGGTVTVTREGGRTIAGFRTAEDKSAKREVSGREIVDDKGNKVTGSTKAAKQEKAALLGTVNKVAKFDVGGVNLIDSAMTDTGHVTIESSTNLQAPGFGSLIIEGQSNKERVELRSAGAQPGPALQGKGYGGTIAAPTVTLANTDLFIIGGSGHNSSNLVLFNAGTVKIKAEQTWTTGANGAYINFETTPSGSPTTSRAERMRITGAGNVGIGTTAPVARLEVAGEIRMSAGPGAGDITGTNGLSPHSGTGDFLFFSGLPGLGINRMTIKNSGNVGIGTPTPGAKLDVTGNINTTTQYNINGDRILSNPGTFNLFAGNIAGSSNTSGQENAFFGVSAGFLNMTGSSNTFVGRAAGQNNTDGAQNSYFGHLAGAFGNSFCCNTFMGWTAGQVTTGSGNTFIGSDVAHTNTSGANNTFMGSVAGFFNDTGSNNTFIGRNAGTANTIGTFNTALGNGADVSFNNFDHATAIGADAVVTSGNRIQLGRDTMDTVSIGKLASASGTALCINGTLLSSCSSSLRYKEQVQPLRSGLKLIQQLRPVTFAWKERHDPDLGLIAEEVAKVEPLLVTHNNKGEIEGVKYDQLNVVLINAVKEQQAQIQQLMQANQQLRQRLTKVERRIKTRRR